MNRFLHVLPAVFAFVASGCEQPAEPSVSSREPAHRATENSRDFGDYVMHFNAISTVQLTPEIARQYDIVRSNNRAMLNVSILRKEPGSTGVPVPGSVSASAVNLTGQYKTVKLREIVEDEAIYYVGEFTVANEETLVFTIDVTPLNEPSRFSIRYTKQFFVD